MAKKPEVEEPDPFAEGSPTIITAVHKEPGKALTMVSTSVKEFTPTAKALAELKTRFANLVFPVNTTAGMKEACQARRELVTLRTGLESTRKEVKDKAYQECLRIDAEAKRIKAFILELEEPIDQQIKAEEERKAQAKEERDKAELERVTAIQQKIDYWRNMPVKLAQSSSQDIVNALDTMETPETIGFDFQEYAQAASDACTECRKVLYTMRAEAVSREIQAEREASEKAEQDRIAKEQEDALASERKRLADERAELESQRAKQALIEAEQAKAAKDAIAAETRRQRLLESVFPSQNDALRQILCICLETVNLSDSEAREYIGLIAEANIKPDDDDDDFDDSDPFAKG